MKLIDADKLLALIDTKIQELGLSGSTWVGRSVLHDLRSDITSIQQNKEALELEMCAEYWWEERGWIMIPPNATLNGIESLLETVRHKIKWNEQNGIKEQPEMDLEKFTEKMDAWKARYNHPDNISIKATMAFTARMFYMYPDIAREWYDSLPKATMD